MSDEDEKEIVVKIDEEQKTEEVVAEKPEAAADTAVADLAKQYKELEEREEATQRAKEAAQRRAEESERAAQEALREAEAAKAQARNSNLDTINTALASATSEVEAAKRDIKIAGEAGDYEAQATAYERLAAAKALALRYDEAKSDLEAAKPERRQEQRQEPRQEHRPTDPVDAYVAGRSAPTEKWLRAHPEFITDRRKNARLNAAHFNAVAEGCEADTDAYFSHVEKFLGLAEAKPNGVKRPAARTVAPTSAATGSSTSSNEVRLTPGEARAATDGTLIYNFDDPSPQKRFKKGDPIGIQEMARRKLAMQKQGAYDRTYEVQ